MGAGQYLGKQLRPTSSHGLYTNGFGIVVRSPHSLRNQTKSECTARQYSAVCPIHTACRATIRIVVIRIIAPSARRAKQTDC